MMTLKEAVKKVRPLDEKAMEGAKQRWDSIAKPLLFFPHGHPVFL